MVEYQTDYSNSYALVIGINDYAHGFIPLGEAEDDAKRIAKVLSGAPYNFSVKTLIGKNASRRAILGQLAELERTDPDSRILFYFAGHGYTETDRYGHPTGFLAAHDTDPDRRFTAIELEDITRFTRHAEAKHISFIFDSCYSAAALGLVAPRDNVAADRYLTSRVYQALTAGEEVVDDTHSMTEYILEVLEQGNVDAETGLLTMRQLADHVRDRMVMQTRSIQKPVLGYLPGSEGGEYLFLIDTNPRLPYDLGMALRSNNGYIRWGAVASLIDLVRRDNLLADLAVKHLEDMAANDPDERVQGAAQSYFDEIEVLRLAEEERARQKHLAHQAEEERARLADLEAQLEEARRKQVESEAALRQAEEAEQRRSEALEAARKAREITPPGKVAAPPEPKPEPLPETPTISSQPVPHPAPTPTTTSIPWAWIGSIAAVVIIGIIGLIAWLSGGGSGPGTQPELTATPTLTAIELAKAGVSTNDEWKPYFQEFAGVKMALVPAGCFMMGSQEGGIDEQPIHEICFDKPFWIDVYEVTNTQYASVGCKDYSPTPDNPRNCVSWTDAFAHCETRGVRLPTEAEWEYAARGPDGLVYPWGNDFVADNLVYYENSGGQTAPVGSKPSGISWVGAYDLSGNLWEWVNDWYDNVYYFNSPTNNPQGPENGEYHILRGGSWYDGNFDARATARVRNVPTSDTLFFVGFRCARDYD